MGSSRFRVAYIITPSFYWLEISDREKQREREKKKKKKRKKEKGVS